MQYTPPDLSSLPEAAAGLFSILEKLNIDTATIHHEAAFTVAQSQQLRGSIAGGHCKSLFLKTRDGQFVLAIVDENKRVDTTKLARDLGTKRMSFAKPEELKQILGVTPGSASPFAIINDTSKIVTVLIDKQLATNQFLNFHPLVNTATTTIAFDDLLKFIDNQGNERLITTVPEPV